jgi:hypothetical protein
MPDCARHPRAAEALVEAQSLGEDGCGKEVNIEITNHQNTQQTIATHYYLHRSLELALACRGQSFTFAVSLFAFNK